MERPNSNEGYALQNGISTNSISHDTVDVNTKSVGEVHQKEIGEHKNTADSGVRMQNRFLYNNLVNKGNIKGSVVDKSVQVKFRSDGTIDTDWLVNRVKSQCNIITTKSKEPTYYVRVKDLSKNVEVNYKGIAHGIERNNSLRKGALQNNVLLNARVTLNLVETLANSIEVNQLNGRGNIDIPFSHVMLGVTGVEENNGNIEYYAVRMVVEERVNQNPILAEANILGRLYAVNAKKIDSAHAQVANTALPSQHSSLFTYKITQLLEEVKDKFRDTFSDDVYQQLNKKEK